MKSQNTLKLYLVISLVFCSISLHSQISFGKNGTFSNKWYSGVIVLKNNDSVKGLIKFESPAKQLMGINTVNKYNKIFFKETKKSKKKKYKKEEVNFFVVKNNFDKVVKFQYVRKSKNKIKLMQVLAEGKVSLYAERGVEEVVGMQSTNYKYFMEKDFYYVKKEEDLFVDNVFFANIFKSFKKTATAYFSECNTVVNKIENEVYKAENLEEIIREYNTCF